MSDRKVILDDVFGQMAKPNLYAKSVILWFSFLFSPLVGGVLMLINLYRINKMSFGITVFLASVVYTLGSLYVGSVIPYTASSRLLVLLLNLAGANLLSGPVWKNAIGKMEYNKANPWLAFALIVIAYALLGLGLYTLMAYTITQSL